LLLLFLGFFLLLEACDLAMGFGEYKESDSTSSNDTLQQRLMVDAEKRRRHLEWCEHHASQQRFDSKSSRVRALFLVGEAYRLEKSHLAHQFAYCRRLIAVQDSDASSPPRIHCESTDDSDCPCLRAPVYRQLPPKFRAMNLLQPHFLNCDLEGTIDSLRETYDNDHEMMDDLLARYGPEDPAVDPHTWMKSIMWRQTGLKEKWRSIAEAVSHEFRFRDNFQTVIRNLSIMRIFLEGSQSSNYSCDGSERLRRDAFHQSVLDELQRRNSLFID
jgi:hypothetical protein